MAERYCQLDQNYNAELGSDGAVGWPSWKGAGVTVRTVNPVIEQDIGTLL